MIKIFFDIFFVLLLAGSARSQLNVSTWAGNQTPDSTNGDRSIARFSGPFGLAISKSGNLFVADANNNCIRKITTDGKVSTLAGSGVAGWKDTIASLAQFDAPSDLCVDDSENVYVCDFNNQVIRRIGANGAVTTIAGNGTEGYVNGTDSIAEFDYPRGIVRDHLGNLFVGDSWNHRIRKISANGIVSTFAGGGTAHGVQSVGAFADGADSSARFNTPCGLAIDSLDNIFVADAYNHRIRKISPEGIVSTIAGRGASGKNNGGFADGDTSVALLNTPTEVCVGTSGIVYFTEVVGERIRAVYQFHIHTLAGDGTNGFQNGIATNTEFSAPRGIAALRVDSILYVCDNGNNCIREIQSPAALVRETLSTPALNIFPNPFENYFFINAPEALMNKRVAVYDEVGREIQTFMLHAGSSQIAMPNVPSGMYYIRTSGDNLAPVVKR